MLVFLVLAAGMVIRVPTAHAETVSTQIPFGAFDRLVIDNAHHREYVSGGIGSPSIAVFDADGVLTSQIPLKDVMGMTLAGKELFVAPTSSHSLAVVDTDSLKVIRRIPLGDFPPPAELTYADGRVWFFSLKYGEPYTSLVSVRTSGANELTAFPSPEWSSDVFVRGDSQDRLLTMLDYSTTPLSLKSCNVNKPGCPVVQRVQGVGTGVEGADAVFDPLTRDVLSAVDPAPSSGHPRAFIRVTMATQGFGRFYTGPPRGAHPNAVDVTSANGGLVAGGTASDSGPDVWVYHEGASAPFWIYDFGASGFTTLPRGVRWSDDGQTIFAVAAEQRSGVPTGPARIFVLHPFSMPSSTLPPAPVLRPPVHHDPLSAQEARALGLLIGLVATPPVVIVWSMLARPAPSSRRKAARIRRRMAYALDSDERVQVAVRASAGFPAGLIFLIIPLAYLATFVFTLMMTGPWVTHPQARLVYSVVVGIVAAIWCRLAQKVRWIVLTDRRLLVCRAPILPRAPGKILDTQSLEMPSLMEPPRATLSTRLAIWGSHGPMTLWVYAIARRQALWTAQRLASVEPAELVRA